MRVNVDLTGCLLDLLGLLFLFSLWITAGSLMIAIPTVLIYYGWILNH